MKFVAVVALIGAAQAADCCINAVDDGNGAFTNDANCAVDPSAACEIPECADANTDTATGNSNGGACTAPAAADPACTETATCTDATPPVCTEDGGAACTGPVPAATPAACTDTAVETDGAWAEADGTACTAAAAEPEGDGAAASTTCETSEDCEGEDISAHQPSSTQLTKNMLIMTKPVM